MTLTMLAVTYRLRVPSEIFRERANKTAERIADAPGFIWKIWGLDPDSGDGTSVYMFRDAATAHAFAEGPVIGSLRNGPAENVVIRIAPIDVGLSSLTGAACALSLPNPRQTVP